MELFILFPNIGLKASLRKYFHFYQGFQNHFQKQVMELSKQKTELLLSFHDICSETSFRNICLFKNQFEKQEMELSKNEIELFLLLPDFGSKTSFIKYFSSQKKEIKLSKREMDFSPSRHQTKNLFFPHKQLLSSASISRNKKHFQAKNSLLEQI